MKNYKKILEGVVNIINAAEKSDIGFANICAYIGENCPELKESRDEKIRKAIYNALKYLETELSWDFLDNVDILDAYAWLEKQGEPMEINLVEILKHYPRETELYSPMYGKLWLAEVDEEHEIITCYKHRLSKGCVRAVLEQEDTISFYSNGTTGLPDFSVSKDCMLFLYDIEKQREKPQGKSALEAVNEEKVDNANEIETKFKVGEWIACKGLNTAKIISKEDLARIINVGDRYEVEFIDGSKGLPHIDYVDRYFHHWTIRDAKGGDVLASKDGEDILIFARLDSSSTFSSYYNTRGKGNCGWLNSWFVPATKEQRVTLMKAMADAGFTFDFKKKKLRKLKFRVGDEIKTANEEPLTITKIDEKGYWSEDLFICGFDDADKWELVGKKIAWSEEDEKILNSLISSLARIGASTRTDSTSINYTFSKEIDWLKSLKDRYAKLV